MTTAIIISICLLLLVAYLFDITSKYTKVPSVLLLLALGVLVKYLSDRFDFRIPNLTFILPVLGTLGLILIVLEGSLELDLSRNKKSLIFKSFFISLFSIALFSILLTTYIVSFHKVNTLTALINVIPLAVISSAIAIPSSKSLEKQKREFITYESSLSDIIGVILFNFLTLNDNFGTKAFGFFTLEIVLMLLISFVGTILLAAYLNKITDHIKYLPIIITIFLIYAIAKSFHLPALLFILIFGLFLGNIQKLRKFESLKKFHPVNLGKEVVKFKEITAELAFLVRALFFILFGYLIEVNDILNTQTLAASIIITSGIYLIRLVVLKVFRIDARSILFIAPRGLITILLFLSIPLHFQIDFVNKSIVTQVIIFTSVLMVVGSFRKNEVLQPLSE